MYTPVYDYCVSDTSYGVRNLDQRIDCVCSGDTVHSDAALCRLAEAGAATASLARKFGVSREMVSRYLGDAAIATVAL